MVRKMRLVEGKKKVGKGSEQIEKMDSNALMAQKELIEMKNLVDVACTWDIKKKELDAKVKEAKSTLLNYAEEHEIKLISGKTAKCKIGPNTTSFIAIKPFLALLKKIGKTNLVPDLLKVKMTDAKKYLGEVVLEDIISSDTDEYGSVTLKPIKKKR